MLELRAGPFPANGIFFLSSGADGWPSLVSNCQYWQHKLSLMNHPLRFLLGSGKDGHKFASHPHSYANGC